MARRVLDRSDAPQPTAQGCPFHEVKTIPADGTPLLPSPSLAEWRDAAPALPLQYKDGHVGWIVTRYERAREVLADDRFTKRPLRMPGEPEIGYDSMPNLTDEELAALEVGNLITQDPPQHTRVRHVALRQFSARAVREREGTVQEIVGRQLAHLKAQGSPADLTEHFALPISSAVHCRVLGIPESHAQRFSALFAGESEMHAKLAFLHELLAIKRADPGDDVISALIESDLTDDEVAGLTRLLLISGHDSVAYLIVTATLALLGHPDQLEALREDPSLIDGAIEEFLRFGTMFITLFPRTATEDVDFGDWRVAKGESVSVSSVAANRDGRKFDRPDEFDIRRPVSGHLGFGHGIHGCLGQQLARLEIREAISQLLAGLPGLHLVEAEQASPMPFAHPVATYDAGSVIVGWE